MSVKKDSKEYLQKKAFYDQLITLYGRKPVLEILQDQSIPLHKLHIASTNKPSGIIKQIMTLAEERQVEVNYHSRKELSRISKNGKQDQGICIDIQCPLHQNASHLTQLINKKNKTRFLALDNITNPQNLGMIIRSACAGGMDGVLMSKQGNAHLDSLVIKASAGTLFKCSIFFCDNLNTHLSKLNIAGADIVGLSSHSPLTLKEYDESNTVIYVLGNETHGISKATLNHCNQIISIPMANAVESLNVAVTASLIAFREKI